MESIDFPFINGAYHHFIVPDYVYQLHVILRGAMGSSCDGSGGLGGLVMSTIPVLPGQELYVYVGGSGDSGGYNGGGHSPTGCNGGGATDIRTIPEDLYSRIVVAGGGGGGSDCGARGGSGGYDNGGSGDYGCNSNSNGYGASSYYEGGFYDNCGSCDYYNAGQFGQGGDACPACSSYSGAGGGGYYGGGGSSDGARDTVSTT